MGEKKYFFHWYNALYFSKYISIYCLWWGKESSIFKVLWTECLCSPTPSPHWRSNQSILKEINPEYSLEGLMLMLKFHTLAT